MPITNFYKSGQEPYVLGRGIVRVKKTTETVWQDLFHVKEFKVTNTADELEHENLRRAVKRVDRTAILKQKVTFTMLVDVPAVDNVLLYLMGETVNSDAQTSGTWTAESFTITEAGKAQELGKRNVSITEITDDTTPTPVPLVEGVDYYLDSLRGLLTIIPSSIVVGTGDDVLITGTYANHTQYNVKAGETAKMQREIWFAGDPAEGIYQDVKGYVLMRPSGEMPFIGDDWQNFSFDGSFMAHPTYGPLGFQYFENGLVV